MGQNLVSPRGAAGLGVVHFVVDAVCVACVLRASPSSNAVASTALAFVLGYDLLAFAEQLPLGWLVDRLSLRRGAALAGIVLTGLALAAGPGAALSTIVLAGVGNALFHLGAGAMVLSGSRGRATPAGIFVAPGALGLGLGMALGRKLPGVSLWPGYLALALAIAIVLLVSRSAVQGSDYGAALHSRLDPTSSIVGLALLLLSVAIRALVGSVACDHCARGTVLLLAVPLAGFAGKFSGGFLADRFGWVEVSVAALLASAPLLAWSNGDLLAAIPGLVLFQLTMLVTLAAVFRILPARPATGFGFLCVALVGGTLPAYLPGGWHPQGSSLFGLVILSAAALFVALRPIESLRSRSPASPILSTQPTTSGGNP